MTSADDALAEADAARKACRDDMHHFDDVIEEFGERAFEFARRRIRLDLDGVPLGRPRSQEELDRLAGTTVTADGLGEDEVLRLFADVLEPACLSTDFPRYFAFIPAAPTETSIIADMVVSACSIYGGTWLEGAGAVWAENQALRWIADLAGLPASAGGCFASGGTMGNLSALVAARHEWRRRRPVEGRAALVVGQSSHTSMQTASEVLDVELVTVPGPKLTGQALAPVLASVGERAFAVVATAGSTNLGLVDDIASVADVCAGHGTWLHVDAAYGGAAMAAPSARPRFDGIERVDSLIVDPHKWLFAPFDACALLYRDPSLARACHAQHSSYLDIDAAITGGAGWNPSDYALHLTRRTRGLPLWFSLAAYGTKAYADAVEACLATARAAAELVREAPHLDLVVEPELSVVAFRRAGWATADYCALAKRLLDAGTAFVVPSAFEGEPMLRICIVNPRTSVDDVRTVLDATA
ncbi:MAG TPA: pyridoxal-dependent decarboxylase [Acidimicrobiales bacterium]|nr:pyridoxal-dependent decarboxylase [Acidimicrobiales bacterium]